MMTVAPASEAERDLLACPLLAPVTIEGSPCWLGNYQKVFVPETCRRRLAMISGAVNQIATMLTV